MSEDQDIVATLMKAAERYRARDFGGTNTLCEALLSKVPNQPDALNMLALVARATKKWGRAESLAKEGIQANPGSASLQNTLGLITLDQRRFTEAESAFRAASDLKPGHPEFRINLGRVMHELGKLDEAEAVLTTVIDSHAIPNAYILRSAIAIERGDLDAAATDIASAAQYNAHPQELLNAKALHAFALGNLEGAYTYFDQIVGETADVADARVNRGLIRLLQGRLAEGWEDYAMRHKRRWARTVKREFPFPEWAGEDLSGKALLLWGEQGLGESLLCCTLFPRVMDEARQITFECEPRLVNLLQRSFPAARFIAQSETPGDAGGGESVDYVSSAMDVFVHRCPEVTQPLHQNGYLKADQNRVEQLREKYLSAGSGNALVGLSWGSPKAANSRIKSVDPAHWVSLLSVPGITFINLQYGDGRQSLDDLASQCGAELITDPDVDQEGDLDQSASQIAALDLVVTVSTTTAHLAGALGQKTWVLLPPIGLGAMWYWFYDRDDSPWYPHVRLLRRHHGEGRDAELLSRVGSDLRDIARASESG